VTTKGNHRETNSRSRQQPSTVKLTETQYPTRTDIQSKGFTTVGKPKGAGCAAPRASAARVQPTERRRTIETRSIPHRLRKPRHWLTAESKLQSMP
jgi:hypothetical protein